MYCNNNPLVYVDLDGKVVTPANIIGAVVGAGGGALLGVLVADYYGLTGLERTATIAGFTVGGAVIGWFAGPIVEKLATSLVAKIGIGITKFGDVVLKAGNTMREKLLNTAQNSKLLNAIDQLYRPGAKYGDGGTADLIKYIAENGMPEGIKGDHVQKATDTIKYLYNIIKYNELSEIDIGIANKLISDLQRALDLYGKNKRN